MRLLKLGCHNQSGDRIPIFGCYYHTIAILEAAAAVAAAADDEFNAILFYAILFYLLFDYRITHLHV